MIITKELFLLLPFCFSSSSVQKNLGFQGGCILQSEHLLTEWPVHPIKYTHGYSDLGHGGLGEMESQNALVQLAQFSDKTNRDSPTNTEQSCLVALVA